MLPWPLLQVMGEEGAPTSTGIGEEDALEDGPWVEGPKPPPPPLFEDDGETASHVLACFTLANLACRSVSMTTGKR